MVVIQFLARSLPQVAEVAEAEQVYRDSYWHQVVLEEEQEVVHGNTRCVEQETPVSHLKVILVVHKATDSTVILVVEAEAVLLAVKQVGKTIITVEMVEAVFSHITGSLCGRAGGGGGGGLGCGGCTSNFGTGGSGGGGNGGSGPY